MYGFGESSASACAILGAILLKGSRLFVGLRGSALVALIGISLFTVLVGADAAEVQAAIMDGLFIIARPKKWMLVW
jgi:hypothetical protein